MAPARGVNPALSRQLMNAFKLKTENEKNEKNEINEKITGVKNAKSSLVKNGFSFSHIRDLYPIFEYKDIASHPAIVVIPYQVRTVRAALNSDWQQSTVQYCTTEYSYLSYCLPILF